MRDETEAHYHPGERVRFYAYATEDRVGIIVGILYDAVADARRFYGYDLVSEGRGYRCSQEAIVGLAPESVLDEDVALRIMQYPSIRLVYDKDGGRYRLARRDENGVGHVDILAQRWPEVPGEEMPVQTGTITGLVSAEQVLFALKMALSQLQP